MPLVWPGAEAGNRARRAPARCAGDAQGLPGDAARRNRTDRRAPLRDDAGAAVLVHRHRKLRADRNRGLRAAGQRRHVAMHGGRISPVLLNIPVSIALWLTAIAGFVQPLPIGRKVKSQMHGKRDTEGSIFD